MSVHSDIPRHGSGRRSGFTLPELLVAMVVMGVVGASLVKLTLSQARFFDLQYQSRNARMTSRGALNILLSDLDITDANAGVTAASSSSITVRVPYAFGIVCGASGGATVVSLEPVDSLLYANAGFSGFAYRDSAGLYRYVESGVATATGAASDCTGASVTTLTNGRVINLTPAMPAWVQPGTPIFLEQRITYAFRSSTALPGKIGLWRRIEATGTDEELVAPFDSTSRFRFFTPAADTSQSAVPTLSTIMGFDLVLNGTSERAPEGLSAPHVNRETFAVFFRNRP
jgi:prepilin-type N-terminal cleavage/methylation domain-containing protein